VINKIKVNNVFEYSKERKMEYLISAESAYLFRKVERCG